MEYSEPQPRLYDPVNIIKGINIDITKNSEAANGNIGCKMVNRTLQDIVVSKFDADIKMKINILI